MSDDPATPPDRRVVTEHDRARLRTTNRVLLAGPVAGVLAAGWVASLGAGGAAGLAVLLVCTGAASVAAALVTALGAIVDEYRHVPVARRRTVRALLLFGAGFLCLLMSAAVAATA